MSKLVVKFRTLPSRGMTKSDLGSPYIHTQRLLPGANHITPRRMLNVGLVGAALSACTALTLYHVYSLKHQFYSICIHLMKSPLSVAVRLKYSTLSPHVCLH